MSFPEKILRAYSDSDFMALCDDDWRAAERSPRFDDGELVFSGAGVSAPSQCDDRVGNYFYRCYFFFLHKISVNLAKHADFY